jgi:hypothetical protein
MVKKRSIGIADKPRAKVMQRLQKMGVRGQ